jgi:hypothetical protein
MNSRLAALSSLFLILSSFAVFADVRANYFTGQEFEVRKIVQILGAPRTPENLEREDQMGKVMNAHLNQLRFCYERVFRLGALPKLETSFYFSVSKDGQIGNVTADLINPGVADKFDAGVKELFSCVSQQISRARAPVWTADGVFKFAATFEVH